MCSPPFASEWMHAYEVLWEMRSHLFVALNRTVGSGASQSPHHCNSTGHIPEIHGLPPAEEEASFQIIPHHHLLPSMHSRASVHSTFTYDYFEDCQVPALRALGSFGPLSSCGAQAIRLQAAYSECL